jgi:hypothetical protein
MSQQVERRPDRPDWWVLPNPSDRDMPYTDLKYDIAAEPLIETISYRDRPVGLVTRNRYNAEVLNSKHLLIIDVDLVDDHGRCQNDEVRRAVLAAVNPRGLRIKPSAFEYNRYMVEPYEFYFNFADLLYARLRSLSEHVNAEAPEWAQSEMPPLAFRIYRTHNGLRLIETGHDWAPTWPNGSSPLRVYLDKIFELTWCDPAYAAICREQGLFRGRLTVKPWRDESGFARACQFIETVGGNDILPMLEPLIDRHDETSQAFDDGIPLA